MCRCVSVAGCCLSVFGRVVRCSLLCVVVCCCVLLDAGCGLLCGVCFLCALLRDRCSLCVVRRSLFAVRCGCLFVVVPR